MFSIIAVVLLLGTSYSHGSSDLGIIGGHDIAIEEVPYIASLRLNGTVHWCGSSIIHKQFVLTAAHCIVPNRNYSVLVGTDKIDGGGRLYEVKSISVHEKYTLETKDYDVCILKLNETLTFGSKVKIIELADKNTHIKKGMLLNTAGWGSTTGPRGKMSKILKAVTVTPVLPQRKCQMSYLTQIKITPRMLCAGGYGKDSCTGDSGGPLTLNNKQVGITSFGGGCGRVPGVYAKVSALLPWIQETIQKNL